MPQTQIGGGTLAWETGGVPDAPPALFLHAGLGRARMWRDLWSGLSGYALVAPDLPGHGGTTFDEAEDLQEQALRHARSLIEEPVHLVGHSFGGTVALRLSLAYPELVRSLTLIEPVYFVFLHDAGHPAYAAHLEEMAALARAFEAGALEEAARVFLSVWGDEPFDSLPERQRREIAARMPLIQATEPAILRPDTPGRLKLADVAALRCPVQLIEGGRSTPTSHAIADVLQEVLPNAARHRVAEAGHMLPITHPVEVSGLISRFWQASAEPHS